MSYFHYYPKDAQKLREEMPQWEGISSLSIELEDEALLEEIFRSPHLYTLESITLTEGAISKSLSLLAKKLPDKLQSLSISHEDPNTDLSLLADLLAQNQLQSLSFWYTYQPSVAPMLSRTQSLSELRLGLCLDRSGCESLAPHLKGIAHLQVDYNNFGDDALEILLQNADLRDTTKFGIASNQLSPKAGKLMAKADLPNLRNLDISDNPMLGDDGIIDMLKAPWIGGLETLRVAQTNLGDRGARAIADCEALANLEDLVAMGSKDPGGDEGAIAIARSPHLSSLRSLWFYPQHMTPEGCLEVLLARPGVESLYEIERKTSSAILKAKAKSMGLKGYSKMNKTQLLDLIRTNLP